MNTTQFRKLGRPTATRTLILLAAVSALAACATACSGNSGDDESSASSNALSTKREYFVSTDGVDYGNTLGDQAHPFRTIQAAANLTQPGDTVTVLEGTYTSAPGGGFLNVTRSGSADAWITFRGLPGHRPRLKFDGWNGISVSPGAAYIEIRGFEIVGSIEDTTLEFCKTQAKIANPICNNNGISVDGRADKNNRPHHIRIVDNDIHHCAAGGASAISADYITIEGNSIHDTSWYTQYASSGISILMPFNFDGSTGYRNFIRNNRVWNNKTQVEWSEIGKLSDGNGIIADTFSAPGNENGDYAGRTLIANNVSVKNGGSGIHAYFSGHVDIVNNTAYLNGQVVGYPDIYSNTGIDVNILNNIMYARQDGRVNDNWNNVNVKYDYNVYFSGSAPVVKGPHDRIGDPLFVDAANGDFRVSEGSPAIDNGTAQIAIDQDIVGAARPEGGAYDIGAYETGKGAQGVRVVGLGGLCLDSEGKSDATGAQMIVAVCDGSTSQQFDTNAAGELRPRHASSMCVDDLYSSTDDNTKIQLWPCNGTNAQKWTLTSGGALQGPGGKCIDVDMARAVPGTKVKLFQCKGNDAQTWTLSQ